MLLFIWKTIKGSNRDLRLLGTHTRPVEVPSKLYGHTLTTSLLCLKYHKTNQGHITVF